MRKSSYKGRTGSDSSVICGTIHSKLQASSRRDYPRLRSTLIKTAAKVSVSVRRVLVELAAHCPWTREIQIIAQRLSTGSQLIFV